MITHEMDVASRAGRVVRMQDGRVIEDQRTRPLHAPWSPAASAGAGAVNIAESVRFALTGVLANKMRSILTTLGILIGIASVIILLAVGAGTSNAIKAQIGKLGTNVLTVSRIDDGGRRAAGAGRPWRARGPAAPTSRRTTWPPSRIRCWPPTSPRRPRWCRRRTSPGLTRTPPTRSPPSWGPRRRTLASPTTPSPPAPTSPPPTPPRRGKWPSIGNTVAQDLFGGQHRPLGGGADDRAQRAELRGLRRPRRQGLLGPERSGRHCGRSR